MTVVVWATDFLPGAVFVFGAGMFVALFWAAVAAEAADDEGQRHEQNDFPLLLIHI